MSWTSPLTVARTMRPFSDPSTRSMYGSRCATEAFITSADWRTNGNCILPEPNSSPTTFIPSSRIVLMMSSGAYDRRASSRSSTRVERSAWTIAFWSRSSTEAAFCFLAVPPFWTVLS